ncbi:hypothetical protein OZ411_29615 [Bradyrhizobium sp. Arg237L]|uniref:hypothetical protein n=1 Tax=Bradyrhizobium sp. Arg237L TaxID=3003352 RepID=UPI00249DE2A5|nr:hypothetical protein [Bradyrhizobium sp. Arg237L]MDI4236975.1 hypothetical protein [Bradyrhizobium sp. Arg237L]
MPTVIRTRRSAPLSRVPQDSADAQFASIALFCGIGMLISFVAVICEVQGVWH